MRFVFHNDPAATQTECVRQDTELLHAVGLVIDRTNDSQRRVECAENEGQTDFIEEVYKQVG
ncbi:MAG: hypothetical protein M3N48_01270 [Verrucomicrobiota bacterium]|nr:hypothetical protein [Verrucomicrobiota bacterium]